MFLFMGAAMVVAPLGDTNTDPGNLTEQEREPELKIGGGIMGMICRGEPQIMKVSELREAPVALCHSGFWIYQTAHGLSLYPHEPGQLKVLKSGIHSRLG